MQKLACYLEEKKKGKSSSFPKLTQEEETEILSQLGLPDHVTKHQSTEEIINGTLRKLNHYQIRKPIDKKSSVREDDEWYEVGTVRIHQGTEEAIGTVRIKNGEEYGTVKFFGTVKVKENGEKVLDTQGEVPDWAQFGSIRLSKEDLIKGEGSIRVVSDDKPKKGSPPEVPAFLHYTSAPEDWEMNILALENGEWNSNMNKAVFGKYKKDRTPVAGLFMKSAPDLTVKREHVSKLRKSPNKQSMKKSKSQSDTKNND